MHWQIDCFNFFQRVSYSPVVVVVVEAAKFKTDEKKLEKIFESAKKFGHPIYFVAVENGVGEFSILPQKIENSSDLKSKLFEQDASERIEKFNSLVSSISEESSRHFFLQCLRKNVLLKSAEYLGCSKIFSAECSNDLAVAIISGILFISNFQTNPNFLKLFD